MTESLQNLYSIINNKPDAKDSSRSFTFIEFIKEFGFDNTTSSFLNDYKQYLSLWASKKSANLEMSDAEYVRSSLIETLKSIVLTYSSYEEQDFISNMDWNNEMHCRAIIPFFADKIKKICDFYKTKRDEAPFIINKNKFNGSRLSIEQIIYDKIVDFYFDSKDLRPQIAELQNNLTIGIEQYVDIYCDYFDIPRHKKCNDASRAEFITANINNVNYEDYINVSKMITELLFSNEVYLEEIPLIAQLALDLSQKCAGDVSTLRDKLLSNATVNLVSLNEQIALRRRLYEKYLGCDLYYIYCEDENNIYIDVLTRADNPSGNLLNCSTADTAAVEADSLKLISNIGLFFKPDKTGILKINADNFTWEIDKEKLVADTFYVFPDPNKYGDIGNNKSTDYPLVFEYKLDTSIKNLSSGLAKDEPLAYLGGTTWNTYYSTQDRDFVLDDNKDFNYSFTSLANRGIITNYQQDIYGNEYGLFKGYYQEGDTIIVPSKFPLPELNFRPGYVQSDLSYYENHNVLFNGGYFEDPRIDNALFPVNEETRLADDYIWTGLSISAGTFTGLDGTHINFGLFTDKKTVADVDHFGFIGEDSNGSTKCPVVFDTFSSKLADLTDKTIKKVNKTADDFKNEFGKLFVKNAGGKPYEFNKVELVKNYTVKNDILLVENGEKIYFFNNQAGNFNEIENISIEENDTYCVLYNESKEMFVIAVMRQEGSENKYTSASLFIHTFDLNTHRLAREVVKTSPDNENFKYITSYPKIDNLAFMYNNSLDMYVLAYLCTANGYPHLYEHRFRLSSEELFFKTLKSCVYYDLDTQYTTPNLDSLL